MTQLASSRPLEDSDKDIIKKALYICKKIYAAARVSSFKRMGTIFEGALALARLDEEISVFLVQLSGCIVWSQSLSIKCELQELHGHLQYRFLDKENNIEAEVSFEDRTEAAKLQDKFGRLIERVQGRLENYNIQTISVSDTRPDSIHDNKSRTIRGTLPRRARTEEWVKESIACNVARHASGTASQALAETSEWQKLEVVDEGNEVIDTWKSEAFDDNNHHDVTTTPPKPTRTRTLRINDKLHQVPDVANELCYISKEKYGKGGFGTVFRGRLRDNTDVAIKRYKPSGPRVFDEPVIMAYSKRFQNEAFMSTLCGRLKHQNIVQFLGIAVRNDFGACLVLPWIENGDSLAFVKKYPKEPRLPIIRGTVCGLAYLHEKGILHGDIKAYNILVANDGTPMICDFGLSCIVDELDQHEMSRSIEGAGNARWMAPEILGLPDSARFITTKTDVWAMGMFAFEILSGDVPFIGQRMPQIYRNIEVHNLPSRPPHAECSDTVWDGIWACWDKDPSARPKAKDFLVMLPHANVHLTVSTSSVSSLNYTSQQKG